MGLKRLEELQQLTLQVTRRTAGTLHVNYRSQVTLLQLYGVYKVFSLFLRRYAGIIEMVDSAYKTHGPGLADIIGILRIGKRAALGRLHYHEPYRELIHCR